MSKQERSVDKPSGYWKCVSCRAVNFPYKKQCYICKKVKGQHPRLLPGLDGGRENHASKSDRKRHEQNIKCERQRKARMLKSTSLRCPNAFRSEKLQNMLKLPPEEIVMQLHMDNAATDLFHQDEVFETNYTCLLIQVLGRAAGAHTNREKLNIVLAKIFKCKFINELIMCSIKISMNTSEFTNVNEYFENMWIALDTYIHAMPSRAVDHLFELLECCLMSLKKQPLTNGSKLIEKYENARTYLSSRKGMYQDHHPPDDFRLIPVVPTSEELNEPEKPFLRRNIINGHYKDVYHYLDVQFRLLREDFIQPLRNGIHALQIGADLKNTEVYIYKDVRILDTCIKNFTIFHNVQIKRSKHLTIKTSKRFMHGNLVCLSCDNFETIYFGFISENNPKMLARGVLGINFENYEAIEKDKSFTMIESKVFFTAYRHVLCALQKINEDNFPMKDFIVHVVNKVPLPDYLQPGTGYDLNVILSRYLRKSKMPLKLNVSITKELEFWPLCNELELDESQRRALKNGLTNKLSIIQGPPGTGKTFIGLKIAKVLYHNSKVWKGKEKDSPILVVSYTNHALDQFLEGLTQFTNCIVRIGSRSESKVLQRFQIKEQLKHMRYSTVMPTRITQAREDMIQRLGSLEVRRASLRRTLLELAQPVGIVSENELLDENVVPRNIADLFRTKKLQLPTFLLDGRTLYMEQQHYQPTLVVNVVGVTDRISDSEDDMQDARKQVPPLPIANAERSAWEGSVYEDDSQRASDLYIEEENERKLDDDDDDDTYTFISGQPCSGILSYDILADILLKEIKNLCSCTENATSKKMIRLMHCRILLEYGLSIPPDTVKAEQIETQNIENLQFEDRWTLYRLWLQRLSNKISIILMETEKEYSECARLKKVIQSQEYLYAMRKASFVGMTTTGAAQHKQVLQALQPRIVIVEEAAEILEAHVVTALSEECQHLIMIGDHQQLQPSTSVHELATKYGLATSLFERLIQNNVEYVTLEYQHRMRPEISQLLVPSIYPTLKDHKSVHQHPHIRGMEKDIFFFTHDHHEEQGKDENSSKANSFEAEFIMALCQHIMLQGYSSDDVTVLTPYSGQFFLLKKIQCKYIQCHNVRISIVDSFQGEESNIIFLSLVRSNEKGNIGFLKKENRVCVALSRAKHGMYIVGSINSLKQSSDLWKEICKNLSSLNAIGNSMTLKCENHPEVLSTVKSGKDIITSSPQGGCTKPCSSSLPKCGHNCPQLCHIIDMQHEFVRCPLPCPKLCQRSHPCPLTCGMKCKPCTVQIPKLLSCEHILKVACSTYEDTHTCCESLEKILPECKHKVVMKCSDDPAIYQCQEPCKMDLSCGHKCTRHCHGSDDPYHLKYECLESCPRSGEGCAMHHVCPKKCFEDCGSCVEQVEKIAKCGHTNLTKCSTPSEQIECTKECKRPLPCGHFCSRKCKDPCEECLEYVTKTIKECQHKIQVKCSEDVDKSICPTPCTLTLPCGHKCQSLCKEPCTVDCQVHVNTSSSCPQGHKIKVPCFLFNKVSGEEAWQFCLQPCSTLLDCKHYCEGNCSLCLHGRVHVTCRKKCEKRLVCGHKCRGECSSYCLPCQDECQLQCSHGRCSNRCGYPCYPCMEKCKRSCQHQVCKRLCPMKCTKNVCEKPCSKRLRCGHPCIGYCGDPCPLLCRICDSEKLAKLIVGNENNPLARFVLLEGCGHVLEAGDLHKLLSQETGEIGMKLCPVCHEPIYANRRFFDLIMKSYVDVQQLLMKLISNIKDQKEEVWEFMKGMQGLSNFKNEVHQICKLFPYTQNMQELSYIAACEVNLCKFRMQVLHQMDIFLNENKAFIAISMPHIHFIKERVMQLSIRISPQMMEEITCELQRLRVLTYIRRLQQSAEESADAELRKILCSIENLMDPKIRFDRDLEEKVIQQLTLSKKYSSDGLPVSVKERITILPAVGLGQGHWFKCPNSHIYNINDCGRATGIRDCPKCSTAISGRQLAL